MHILVGYASYIIKSFFQFQGYLSQRETLVLDLKVSGQYVKIHFSAPKYKQNKMLIHFVVIEFFRS